MSAQELNWCRLRMALVACRPHIFASAALQAAPLGEHPQDEFHFPFGVLINPEPLSGRSLNVHYEAPPTCKTCGAFTADHAPWSPRTDPTSCPFCTSGNHRITENAADFIVSASSPPPYPPPTIIAVDLGAPHDAIEHVKDALIKALESLPDTAPIALLAYGQFVSAYRLLGGSGNDGAHADVLVQRTGAQEAHIHIAPLSSCRPILINALESLRCVYLKMRCLAALFCKLSMFMYFWAGIMTCRGQPCRASNLSRLTRVLQATEELLEKQNIASMHPQVQAMERPAGVAGRLIIISAAQGDLSGGTSSSDEVEEAMEGLAERAASCGIIADAVLVGTSPGFGAALGTLVYGTGGVLLPQAAAGSALASNLKSVLVRQSGMNCTLEIRCSSGLEVVDAVGPLLPVSQGGQSVSRDPETASLPHRLQSVNSWSWLCNTPEAHQGMAITLQTSSPAKVGQDVHLQIALVWKRTDGAKVYRIASKALPVKHADAAVTVADMEAAAIFMAKAIAAHALEKKAANNRMQAEILRRRLGEWHAPACSCQH